MAANASGSTESTNYTTTTISLINNVSGPMGDAPQKRPLEDGEEPGAKKLASVIPGSVSDSFGIPSAGVMSENMRLPDDLVGLIIGRKGENIMRMQRETGCRIQITQSMPGTKDRPCTLSGTPEQIEVCRNMLSEIIARSQAGTLSEDFNLNSANMGMGDGPEKSVEMSIPPDKCGLIIGKKGETIKMLQQNLHVKMLLIQDSTENQGQPKPLRISGAPMHVDNAVNAIHQMMAQRDKMLEQKMDPPMFGDDTHIIPIPKAAVGVVIGKRGDMINQLQSATSTRIQFKPEDPTRPDRICTVTGHKDGVEDAIQRINQIIQNVQERDGMKAGNRNMGMGGPPGGMGGFGHWEGPGGNRDRGMGVTTEEHLVPANKTGLVIGKGGETIKQINMQSGAHAEIQRNPPPGSDPSYKMFIIKGTLDQIKMARQLIQEKVDSYVGGGHSMPGGPMNGPPGHGPPPGNFGPPPHSQQNSFGGMPPGASYAPPNPMQAPPQAQPSQSFQQPWGGQFQQWNPTSVAAPQQNGADPNKPLADAYSAAWQNYLSQTAYQNPAASAAPAAATPAATVPQPDYSKQWDEYLKQTGAAAQAAAVAAQAAAAPTAAQALQPVAAAPAAPAAAPIAAAQPATTQADYSAQWAEYYRQFYQLQGQQYAAAAAAAAGQAPAQP